MTTEKQIREFCLDYSSLCIFNYELNSVPTGNFLNIYSHIYTQLVRQKERRNREAQNTILETDFLTDWNCKGKLTDFPRISWKFKVGSDDSPRNQRKLPLAEVRMLDFSRQSAKHSPA